MLWQTQPECNVEQNKQSLYPGKFYFVFASITKKFLTLSHFPFQSVASGSLYEVPAQYDAGGSSSRSSQDLLLRALWKPNALNIIQLYLPSSPIKY